MSFSTSLPKDAVLERIQAMIFQEETSYQYESYLPTAGSNNEMEVQSSCSSSQPPLNASWREKICQWSYNVVDHFDLPREVVAISLDLFDRYLATRANQCSGNMALLASLTTLHIAIKIHSEKNIKVVTLASLSRGQFGAKHIEEMEWQIFEALGWKLHPPTLFAFVSHILMLFPNDVHQSVRKELFEVAIYMAELSVCDSFFVKFSASTVALAAIINVMEDIPAHRLSHRSRDAFWLDVSVQLGGFSNQHDKIQAARDRLKAMFVSTAPAAPNSSSSATEPTSSPTSTTDMQVEEAEASSSACTAPGADSSSFFSRSRGGSFDSKDRYRYSPSPNVRRSIASSPMSCSRSRIASSPIVAGTQ